MPIKKAAIKSLRQGKKRAAANAAVKSEIKSNVKKLRASVKEDGALERLSQTFSLIDKAVSKGIVKRESGDRKKARLASLLNKSKAV